MKKSQVEEPGKKKSKREKTLKTFLLELPSAVRWSVLGFIVTFCLFFIQISLTCYSLYSSLDCSNTSWLIFMRISLGFAVALIIFGGCLFCLWKRNNYQDTTAERVLWICEHLETYKPGNLLISYPKYPKW